MSWKKKEKHLYEFYYLTWKWSTVATTTCVSDFFSSTTVLYTLCRNLSDKQQESFSTKTVDILGCTIWHHNNNIIIFMPSKIYSIEMQFPAFLYNLVYMVSVWIFICSYFTLVIDWFYGSNLYFTVMKLSFEELKLNEPTCGISKSRALIWQTCVIQVFTDTENILLVLLVIQTQMLNYHRNEKSTRQIMEGTCWMIGRSVLTSQKGCMSFQAVHCSPFEKLWHF